MVYRKDSAGSCYLSAKCQSNQVLLLETEEEFLNNKHLEVSDMEGEFLSESELRGAMNTIELSIDRLYQNINERACQMA